MSLNVKLTTLGSDPINFFKTKSKLEFMGSDPITKFLRQKHSRVETPGCLLTLLFFMDSVGSADSA